MLYIPLSSNFSPSDQLGASNPVSEPNAAGVELLREASLTGQAVAAQKLGVDGDDNRAERHEQRAHRR